VTAAAGSSSSNNSSRIINAPTWAESAAALAASAAARPILSGARRRRHNTRRCGTLSRAWRGASRHPSSCRSLRRTTRPSRWRNRPNPTPLAPRPRPLALVRDSATRPHVSSSSAFSPNLTHLSLSLQRLRPNLWMEWRVGTRRQQHTWFGRGGRRQHGQSDGHPPWVICVLITALLGHRSTKTALGLRFQEVDFS
jgi:hypothetical protein